MLSLYELSIRAVVNYMLPRDELPKTVIRDVEILEPQIEDENLVMCNESIAKFVIEEIENHHFEDDPYPLSSLVTDYLLNEEEKENGWEPYADTIILDIFYDRNLVRYDRIIKVQSSRDGPGGSEVGAFCRSCYYNTSRDGFYSRVVGETLFEAYEMFSEVLCNYRLYCSHCRLRLFTFRATDGDITWQSVFRAPIRDN